MTKTYEYKGQEFKIDKLEDSGLEVSKDDYSVKILKDTEAEDYMITSSDALDVLGRGIDPQDALDLACEIIFEYLEVLSEKQTMEENLGAGLDNLYDKL